MASCRAVVYLDRHQNRRDNGMMNTDFPDADLATVQVVLETFSGRGARFHALQARHAGLQSFFSVRMQVPAYWTVVEGHSLASEVESRIGEALPHSTTVARLEPLDGHASRHSFEMDLD